MRLDKGTLTQGPRQTKRPSTHTMVAVFPSPKQSGVTKREKGGHLDSHTSDLIFEAAVDQYVIVVYLKPPSLRNQDPRFD